jgi:hypothetical protein
MQFVQSVNVRHHGGPAADGWTTGGSMYLPGMSGPAAGRINYTIRRRAVDDALDGHNDDVLSSPTKLAQIESKQQMTKKSLQEEIIAAVKEPRPVISYQVVPGGPWRKFKAAKTTSRKNQRAATTIQRLVRGHCARTKTYVMRLERKLAFLRRQTQKELRAIAQSKDQAMLTMRQHMIKQEARTLKDQMACAETAAQGVQLIQHLRRENKKLRDKNDKIARAIAELRYQNERLEKAATLTVSNESVLSNHYHGQIVATQQALQVVVPQFQKKLRDMTEALDVRRQYWSTERKMKILYVQTVGAVVELVEDQCDDRDLVHSVMTMCVALKDALPKGVEGEEEKEMAREVEEVLAEEENSEYDDDDSDDSSDSNDYDEYDIADFRP